MNARVDLCFVFFEGFFFALAAGHAMRFKLRMAGTQCALLFLLQTKIVDGGVCAPVVFDIHEALLTLSYAHWRMGEV